MKNCGILGRKNGFSLIEMSVVIIIIGLITAAAFSMLTANLEITQYTNTKAKLNTIVTALQRFYAANNRLPCPAQGTLKLGDATYGQEIFSGLCDRAVTAANNTVPAGTYAVDSGGGNWVRQGAIPSRALGLPDSMMYDDYGNKFSYAVTEKFTTSSVAGVINVNDGKGNNIATNIAMVVFSHGRDAKGAYNSAGLMGIACDAGVHLDKENCDADAVFTDTTYNASVDGANWYDDAIVWADKNLVIGLTPSTTGGSASASGGSCGYEFFVDSGSFTRPAGVTSFRVLAIGGGGGGGGGYGLWSSTGSGGGGSGYLKVGTVTLNTDPTTVTVGSAGAGGCGLCNGGDGAASSISTISAAGGVGANRMGTGGAGGIGGLGGTASNTVRLQSGGSQSPAISISAGGTVVSDGTNTVIFKCAKFRMPPSAAYPTGAYVGGTGGNGISSEQAPKFGSAVGGAVYTAGANGVNGTNGGGSGGSCTNNSSILGGGGGGGAVGGSVASNNSTWVCSGGGGGGYGGGAGATFSGSSYTGGSGGGVSGAGGGAGGYSGAYYGGSGGSGYGAGGGGGSGACNPGGAGCGGGGGGANGLVYIEWDQ